MAGECSIGRADWQSALSSLFDFWASLFVLCSTSFSGGNQVTESALQRADVLVTPLGRKWKGGGLGGNRFGAPSGLPATAPKRGPKSNIKKDPKKDTKRGPKGDPKNHKKAIRAKILGVSEGS